MDKIHEIHEINEIKLLQEKNTELENELIQMKIIISKLNFKHFYETHKIFIKKIANDCKNKRNFGIYIIDDLWNDNFDLYTLAHLSSHKSAKK